LQAFWVEKGQILANQATTTPPRQGKLMLATHTEVLLTFLPAHSRFGKNQQSSKGKNRGIAQEQRFLTGRDGLDGI